MRPCPRGGRSARSGQRRRRRRRREAPRLPARAPCPARRRATKRVAERARRLTPQARTPTRHRRSSSTSKPAAAVAGRRRRRRSRVRRSCRAPGEVAGHLPARPQDQLQGRRLAQQRLRHHRPRRQHGRLRLPPRAAGREDELRRGRRLPAGAARGGAEGLGAVVRSDVRLRSAGADQPAQAAAADTSCRPPASWERA